MRNTFGQIFTLTTFGESHGEAIGGVVDGMPAGIDIDIDFIQEELNKRRPGQSHITTARQEADKVELLSGIFEGKSTGDLSDSSSATTIRSRKTTRVCGACSVRPMPTTLIIISMEFATIVVADARRHA